MGGDDDTYLASLLGGRPISMNRPKIFLVLFRLWDGEFRYKVCQCLSFYDCMEGVSYIKLTELNSLLYHPTSSFRFIHRF